MTDHDLVVRGGTVVDGTGAPGRAADVAVDGGRVSLVGTVPGRGREELDADGLLVTPGWVDVHTHYDGQATWDDLLTPSSWQGVTTVVMGNCGVGFAPCRPADRDYLTFLMEGVEDIPRAAIAAGMRWRWESFPEYLDVLVAEPVDRSDRHERGRQAGVPAELHVYPGACHGYQIAGDTAIARQAMRDADDWLTRQVRRTSKV